MDILALSRIEQNPVPENVELVEVDEVIEQSARTIFEMATEKYSSYYSEKQSHPLLLKQIGTNCNRF